MARQCNECERPADVDLFTLRNNEANYHFVQAFCAEHAIKAHKKPRNKPRESFYLRETMQQEQVLREMFKSE